MIRREEARRPARKFLNRETDIFTTRLRRAVVLALVSRGIRRIEVERPHADHFREAPIEVEAGDRLREDAETFRAGKPSRLRLQVAHIRDREETRDSKRRVSERDVLRVEETKRDCLLKIPRGGEFRREKARIANRRKRRRREPAPLERNAFLQFAKVPFFEAVAIPLRIVRRADRTVHFDPELFAKIVRASSFCENLPPFVDDANVEAQFDRYAFHIEIVRRDRAS